MNTDENGANNNGQDLKVETSQMEIDRVTDIVCFLIAGIFGAIVGVLIVAMFPSPISPWWGASMGIFTGLWTLFGGRETH